MKAKKANTGGYFTYMVRCKYGTFYAGWTNDIIKRLAVHNEGKGAKYLRGRGPVSLVYLQEFGSAKEAQDREREIKKLSKDAKNLLVQSFKNGQR